MELQPRAFDRAHDHWWWRPGWGPGTRFLTFHLTFEDAPELHAAAEATAERIGGEAAVDLVPVEWLHLTMTGVGHTADLDEEAVASLRDAVFSRSSQVAAEPLRFPTAFAYPEGFGLAAELAPWLADLERIQADEVRTLTGTTDDDGDGFRPHVSLAYFSGDAALERVDDVLRALPDEDVVVAHPRLSLIEIGRDDRRYTWRVVDQLVLA